MPYADPMPDPKALDAFVALCGRRAWRDRVTELGTRSRAGRLSGRAAQARHGLELTLARLTEGEMIAPSSRTERRLCAFAAEAVALAETLPAVSRARLRERLLEGLTGEATLIPLFHLLRTAALLRSRGFAVAFSGLKDGTPHDLAIVREGVAAEVVVETISAEEGRPVQRGNWCALVDAINPELQTWLAAHPGRYLLKLSLPAGLSGPEHAAELQQRISALLRAEKRQDSAADAVLKLDPLVLAGALALNRPGGGLPAQLRQEFGPDAQLAVTTDTGSGSVFVMAARAGRENGIAGAVCRRLRAATARLSGTAPGIEALFLDDVERGEWRALRDTLELEGAVRRFLTCAEARTVVAVSCASRFELFGAAEPDAAPGGELRFRNPGHPAAKLPALAPAVLSSV